MLRPGKYYPGSVIRLTIEFTDDDGDFVDPTTVVLKTISPQGVQATLTYGTDVALGRASLGNYYADITPNEGGRWFYRWETTGSGTTLASEGDILVQYSPFVDRCYMDDYA